MSSRSCCAVGAALLWVGVLVAAAAADEPGSDPPKPTGPQDLGPVQAFGTQNTSCLEWSDACIVCQRDDDGAVHCSTSGIACTAGLIVCRREKP